MGFLFFCPQTLSLVLKLNWLQKWTRVFIWFREKTLHTHTVRGFSFTTAVLSWAYTMHFSPGFWPKLTQSPIVFSLTAPLSFSVQGVTNMTENPWVFRHGWRMWWVPRSRGEGKWSACVKVHGQRRVRPTQSSWTQASAKVTQYIV